MNFNEMVTEVQARGFTFQDTTRIGRWVNQSHQELCDQESWPFLIASVSGPAPLTIADLGVVQGVRRADGSMLTPADFTQIADDFSNLTQTGTPAYYFPTATGVGVFPVSTASITVRYWRVPVDMSGVDIPAVPARFHELIVLGALRRAALEESDGPDYQSFDAEWQRGLQTMRERVLLWHRDGASSALSVAESGDE